MTAFASERTPPLLKGGSNTSTDTAKAATRLARSSAIIHEVHHETISGRLDDEGFLNTRLNR